MPDEIIGARPARAPQRLTPAERAELIAARALSKLPPAAKRALAGQPIRRDGLELDLDMQLLVRLAERNGRPPLASGTPEDARAYLRRAIRTVEGPPIALAAVEDVTVAGAVGQLAARMYVPEEAQNATASAMIVYFHGGGWVTGDLDTHDRPCGLLARSSGARVLSVAYRLAPEHPFPAAVDDALAAFRDAVARASQWGADARRVAVAGDSAGGHLAAVTSQQSAGSGIEPAFQLLVYPVTDCANVAPSRLTFAQGFILEKENMDWYEAQFLAPDSDRRDPRVSPLLAEQLEGVAPAMVVTAGFDPLRDEGEAYARRLRDAGVRTLPRRHPGYVHGFTHALTLGNGPREALAEMGGVLRAALA